MNVKTLTVAVVAALLLAGCSSRETSPVAAPTSVAADPGAHFLSLAHRDKLPSGDQTLIQEAQDYCSSLPFATPSDAQIYVDELEVNGHFKNDAQARVFEVDAASAFCPDKAKGQSG
jgi:nitrous oxide reductase accessory protein NosL